MSLNIGGLAALVVFYLAIMVVGIFAAKKKGRHGSNGLETSIVADRNIGTFVGIFTMTGMYNKFKKIRAGTFYWPYSPAELCA